MKNIKKVFRFIQIYGFERTLFKVLGRARFNFIKFPILKKKSIGLIGCGQFGFATIGYFISKKAPETFLRAYDIDKKNQISFEKFHKLQHTTNITEIINDKG